MLVNVAGTIANVLGGIVTCENVLMSMCNGSNVDIWLTCSGNGAGSNITWILGVGAID